MPVSIEKLQQDAPALVSLAKEAEVQITNAGLVGHQARVALCLDDSGSMSWLYSSGAVQRTAERVLALSTQFDDDGAIDVFFFGSRAVYAGELTIQDYVGGIDRLRAKSHGGSTDYAGAIKEVCHHMRPGKGRFLHKGPSNDLPVFCAFFTDGEPDSKHEAKDALIKASELPVWFCFVGIGRSIEEFPFLHKLDDLAGRRVDNAFAFADDGDGTTDAEVYEALLMQYPEWLHTYPNAGVKW